MMHQSGVLLSFQSKGIGSRTRFVAKNWAKSLGGPKDKPTGTWTVSEDNIHSTYIRYSSSNKKLMVLRRRKGLSAKRIRKTRWLTRKVVEAFREWPHPHSHIKHPDNVIHPCAKVGIGVGSVVWVSAIRTPGRCSDDHEIPLEEMVRLPLAVDLRKRSFR